MYFSINRFTGDGTTTQWEFNFSGGYIDQAHVKVLVTDPLGVETIPTYTWVGPNTISIVPAVASGSTLEVYRDTPKNLPLVDYTDGAIVSEQNLDTSAEQTVFATAEIADRFADVQGTNEQAIYDSALALSLATTASNEVQQALTDSANAVAAVAGAITAANNAQGAADAANSAAALATQAVVDVTATANSALAIATDAEATATGIAATANQALLDSAEALSTATGIAATANQALLDSAEALSTANGSAATAGAALTAANAAAAMASSVSLTSNVTGTLPVAQGGTGATALTSGAYLKGAGTSAVTAQSGIPAADITSGTVATARLGSGTANNTTFLRGDSTWQSVPIPSTASTAAAQEGTNNTDFLTPLRMREGFNALGSAPVYACRAWVNFDGTTTPPTIRASGNVSSVARNGTGDYTVNFATAMPDVNYCVQRTVSTSADHGLYGESGAAGQPFSLTTTSVRIEGSRNSSAVRRDAVQMHVTIFR